MKNWSHYLLITLMVGLLVGCNSLITPILPSLQREYTVDGRVISIAISPDGAITALALDNNTIELRDTQTQALLNTLEGHTADVTAVAFSQDGKQLASSSVDKTVRLWNVSSGALAQTLEGHTGSVTSVAFSPMGQQVASGSADTTVKIWDSTNGELTQTLEHYPAQVQAIAYASNGNVLAAVAGNDLYLWQLSDMSLLGKAAEHTAPIWNVAFSPDGRLLATTGQDLTTKLWQASDGTLQNSIPLPNTGRNAKFIPNTPIVAILTLNSLIFWNTETGKQVSVMDASTKGESAMAISEDGTLLLIPYDHETVQQWRIPQSFFEF